MKKILALTLTCLFLVQNFAQELSTNEYEIKNNLSDYHLTGKIEKITTTATDLYGRSITLPFLENEFYNEIVMNFNLKGKLTKRTNLLDYRGKLGVYNFIEYNYNENNYLIEQKNTIINNGEDPLRISSLKQFKYDSKGNFISLNENVKNKNSSATYQTDFIYSTHLDQITTKVDGTILSKKMIYYNRNGKLSKEENVSFDGKKGLIKYYVYDKETPIYIEEDVENRKQIQYYDVENGNGKFQQFDHNQNLKLELVFNSNKNVTEAKVQSYQNGKSALKNYQLKYEFDAVGNWVKATIYSENEIKYYLNRTINYY